MDNTSSSRSAKIDDLSKDTPNVPRSFLDRLSDKVLAIITPKEVTELYDVQRVGSGHNSGAPASSPLDLSQVSQLIDQAANELRLATPETFVKPVLRVGSGSLTPKDMEILRNYRKDTRGFSSLEGTVGTAKSAGVERPGTDPYTGCPRVERLQNVLKLDLVVCWVRTAGCCRQQLNGSKLGKWKGSIWE